MKPNWKLGLNVIFFGLSILSIIGGVWWSFIDIKPESVLAFITAITSLVLWFLTREDKKEQEKDKNDIIQTTVKAVEETGSTITHEMQNLPKNLKRQDLIAQLIGTADEVSTRFPYVYDSNQLRLLREHLSSFDKLRSLSKFEFGNDLSEIQDVFQQCIMELGLAIRMMEDNKPVPSDTYEKRNDVFAGKRREELDRKIKLITEQLHHLLKEFESKG